jgi:hypothetical protein
VGKRGIARQAGTARGKANGGAHRVGNERLKDCLHTKFIHAEAVAVPVRAQYDFVPAAIARRAATMLQVALQDDQSTVAHLNAGCFASLATDGIPLNQS